MLPARPKIVLLAPKQILPGAATTLTVRLDSPRPTPIDFVDLFLDGNEVQHGGQSSFVRLGARLREKGRLEAGTTELDCRIDLPSEVPPSYEGHFVRLRYEARVHVSVPYWPDARRSFVLNVRPRPRAPDENVTLLFASAAGGAPVSGPYAEVSLESRSLATGDTLRGAVALYNVGWSRYDKITLTLRARESVAGAVSHPGSSWVTELPGAGIVEGEPVSFAVRVPEMAPALSFRRAEVTHELVVTVRAGWRDVITMPIGIDLLPDPNVDSARARSAPAVGESRVRAIWARVADGTSFRLEDERLVRSLGQRELVVRRDLTGGAPRLLAELRYPSLGLGLRATPRPFFQFLPPRAPEMGIAPIDRAMVFEARSRTQATDVLVRLGVRLRPLMTGRVTLQQLDDGVLSLALSDSGTTEAAVQRMVELAEALGRDVAPALEAIPLPPPLAGLESVWSSLAQGLGTSVEMGSGTLEGDVGDAKIALRLVFDAEGQARALRLSRREVQALEVATPIHIDRMEGLSALREDARRAARPLLERGVELALASDEVSITDADLTPDGLAERTEDAFTDLARLAAALRPTRGPFR